MLSYPTITVSLCHHNIKKQIIHTKDSKTLPLIEKLSVMLTDNFEFFNETQMQDIINSDNNNESIENE